MGLLYWNVRNVDLHPPSFQSEREFEPREQLLNFLGIPRLDIFNFVFEDSIVVITTLGLIEHLFELFLLFLLSRKVTKSFFKSDGIYCGIILEVKVKWHL